MQSLAVGDLDRSQSSETSATGGRTYLGDRYKKLSRWTITISQPFLQTVLDKPGYVVMEDRVGRKREADIDRGVSSYRRICSSKRARDLNGVCCR